ncbi:cyclic nucleotide-binding domain-containing protein [Caldithrix abyssi]|nr:cyclic nucleotide-binding domain-containing protein [Caldithrix abyssi]
MTSFLEKHSIHRFRAGDIIFREGSVGNAMYIIQIGEVEVFRTIHDREISLAHLKKGAIFGEMALVDDHPRSASVRASTNCSCLVMSRVLFKKQMEAIPKWMKSFYQILIERLRDTNKKTETLSTGEKTKQVIYLLAKLLSHETPNRLGKTSINWEESAKEIAFILNHPFELVVKTMNALVLTPLAKGEIHKDIGRQFCTEDGDKIASFAQYCKHSLDKQNGRNGSCEFDPLPEKEMLLLGFIGKLMNEQARANDLDLAFFQNRCIADLDEEPEYFMNELSNYKKQGIINQKRRESGESYYEIDRNLLTRKLTRTDRIEYFKALEKKLCS